MPTSQPSSGVSASCHLEWWPSRVAVGFWLLLALLQPLAFGFSALPAPLKWALACVLALAALRGAWREWHQPPRHLRLADGALWLDGLPCARWQGVWRAGWFFLTFEHRSGRGRLLFWPDTLPPPERRALRLALRAAGAGRHPAGVAT